MDLKEARELVNIRKKDHPNYTEAVEMCIEDDKPKDGLPPITQVRPGLNRTEVEVQEE